MRTLPPQMVSKMTPCLSLVRNYLSTDSRVLLEKFDRQIIRIWFRGVVC
jgi:hypothetical protein